MTGRAGRRRSRPDRALDVDPLPAAGRRDLRLVPPGLRTPVGLARDGDARRRAELRRAPTAGHGRRGERDGDRDRLLPGLALLRRADDGPTGRAGRRRRPRADAQAHGGAGADDPRSDGPALVGAPTLAGPAGLVRIARGATCATRRAPAAGTDRDRRTLGVHAVRCEFADLADRFGARAEPVGGESGRRARDAAPA